LILKWRIEYNGEEKERGMDRETIYLVDDDGRRKERTARFLAGLAFDVKTCLTRRLISRRRGGSRFAVSLLDLLKIGPFPSGEKSSDMSLIGFRPRTMTRDRALRDGLSTRSPSPTTGEYIPR
jgi:hypothetical protein